MEWNKQTSNKNNNNKVHSGASYHSVKMWERQRDFSARRFLQIGVDALLCSFSFSQFSSLWYTLNLSLFFNTQMSIESRLVSWSESFLPKSFLPSFSFYFCSCNNVRPWVKHETNSIDGYRFKIMNGTPLLWRFKIKFQTW